MSSISVKKYYDRDNIYAGNNSVATVFDIIEKQYADEGKSSQSHLCGRHVIVSGRGNIPLTNAAIFSSRLVSIVSGMELLSENTVTSNTSNTKSSMQTMMRKSVMATSYFTLFLIVF